MASFKQRLEQLTKLQHKLAIWEMLHAHLDDNFIAKDGRDCKVLRVPGWPIRKDGGDPDESVREDTFDEVLEEMAKGPIEEVKKQIKAIEEEQGGSDAKVDP